MSVILMSTFTLFTLFQLCTLNELQQLISNTNETVFQTNSKKEKCLKTAITYKKKSIDIVQLHP